MEIRTLTSQEGRRSHHPRGDGIARTSALRGRRRVRSGNANTSVLLLIVALAVVATVLCYRAFESRYDTELRRAVSAQLAKTFPRASVFVGQVSYDGPSSIVVSDVRFANIVEGVRQQVASIDRVTLKGQLDIADVVQQTVAVEQLYLQGIQVEAWQLADGSWSVDCLKPQAQPSKPTPRIVIEDALLRLRQSYQDEREVILHDIQGQVSLQPPARDALQLESAGSTPQFRIELSGRSNGLLQSIEVEAICDPVQQAIFATGRFDGLHYSNSLVQQLPSGFAKYFSQLSGLECEASSNFFEVRISPGQSPQFLLEGRINSGRLQDPRLPYPIEDLSSDFFCRNALLQLRSMHARSGGAELTCNTDINGFGLDSPMVVHADVKNLDLDKRLYQSLPPRFQQQWDRLELTGRVSGSLELSFDGTTWIPTASVYCQGVSMRPWLFPYPLTHIEGQVHYQNNTVSSRSLQGRAGGQPVTGSLSLTREGTEWFGKLQCRTGATVSINEQLVAALTPINKPATGAEQFVRSMHASGEIELVNATFERYSAQDPVWHRVIDANIYGGTVNYDGFRYPIYDIRGRLFCQDDRWFVDQFEGRNDSARILCSGNWSSVREGETPFSLEFNAFAVPIEEELFQALPEDAKYVWRELQPDGSIDSVTTTIVRQANSKAVETHVVLTEDSSSNQVSGRSLRLFPKHFPYLLSDVSCRVDYRPGLVSIDRASAHNGATRLALTGLCRPNSDGRWQADVQWLPTTRFIVDSQFLNALPKSVRESLVKLDFHGPISLMGSSQVLFGNAAQENPTSSWDCQLDVEDGRLADGKYIGDMRGTLWVKGSSDGVKLNAAGVVGMDALTVMGIPVANLSGPFALLDSKLFFGATVQEVLPQLSDSHGTQLTAEALAGNLVLSGHGRLDIGKFYLDAALQNADLGTLLQDVGVQGAEPQALCNANLHFNGTPWNPHSYAGEGSVHLTDARLYELPFMIRLLGVASVSASDASAFQRADIDFTLDGDRIPLQVAADGDVLRLRGEGWMNLRREIDLELYSYVGRRVPITNVISPLLAESRYATFMMIEIDGTLDNPNMQRRPFPQLEATLQQIFPEVAERKPLRDAMPWR